MTRKDHDRKWRDDPGSRGKVPEQVGYKNISNQEKYGALVEIYVYITMCKNITYSFMA